MSFGQAILARPAGSSGSSAVLQSERLASDMKKPADSSTCDRAAASPSPEIMGIRGNLTGMCECPTFDHKTATTPTSTPVHGFQFVLSLRYQLHLRGGGNVGASRLQHCDGERRMRPDGLFDGAGNDALCQVRVGIAVWIWAITGQRALPCGRNQPRKIFMTERKPLQHARKDLQALLIGGPVKVIGGDGAAHNRRIECSC